MPGRPTRDIVYQRLEQAVGELNARLGGLPRPADADEIWSRIWHQEAHHSTAIEGNTLIMSEVDALLADGRAIGAKPLRDYLEVQGYAAAAQWVYAQAHEPSAALMSLQDVRYVHHLAMSSTWLVEPHPHATSEESPGNFRRHEIAAFGSGMKPPSWTEVDQLLLDWVHAANSLGTGWSGPLPERLAELHAAFERIHPFLDGNGRTGRLLLNLLLGRLGYPPAIIYNRDRRQYMTALSQADQGKFGMLGELIARSVTDNLNRFVLPAIADEVELLPLAALATEGLSEGALRVAATRRRLYALHNPDGTWLSSRVWVDEYARSKYRRKPHR